MVVDRHNQEFSFPNISLWECMLFCSPFPFPLQTVGTFLMFPPRTARKLYRMFRSCPKHQYFLYYLSLSAQIRVFLFLSQIAGKLYDITCSYPVNMFYGNTSSCFPFSSKITKRGSRSYLDSYLDSLYAKLLFFYLLKNSHLCYYQDLVGPASSKSGDISKGKK